jgi:hypothetical protein
MSCITESSIAHSSGRRHFKEANNCHDRRLGQSLFKPQQFLTEIKAA